MERGPDWVLQEVGAAGLRGCGGAGFPASRKWRAVAEAPGRKFVLANGEEGEPPSWKDRALMREGPERVLEGVAVAMLAVGAEKGYVYLSDELAASALHSARDQYEILDQFRIEIVTVKHTYVAGEETAAVRFINGGPALPMTKPPRPFEAGIGGRPTLVNNVETLAHAAWIMTHGSPAFRSIGTPESPGSFLACVSGAVMQPLLLEVPYGTKLSEVVSAACPTEELWGVLLGGYFSGFFPASLLDTPATHDDLRQHACGLGNGAIVAVGRSTCPVKVIGDLLAFFAAESAQQCGVCVKGTAAMRDILAGLRTGMMTANDLERLASYGESLRGRGACQLLDGAAMTAARAITFFGPVLTAHLTDACAACRKALPDPTGGYAITDLPPPLLATDGVGRSRSLQTEEVSQWRL
ncbi:MAG TPA: NADH-ubiquinone oxidoreductase-F iron-sulfur binding region domain-containing protein [Arthrobacter sp.]|nr:NADH-ubiquinone oxidoreductase-F iron-sulfur binding region domain-containing protein [Arthrobacter sp.]